MPVTQRKSFSDSLSSSKALNPPHTPTRFAPQLLMWIGYHLLSECHIEHHMEGRRQKIHLGFKKGLRGHFCKAHIIESDITFFLAVNWKFIWIYARLLVRIMVNWGPYSNLLVKKHSSVTFQGFLWLSRLHHQINLPRQQLQFLVASFENYIYKKEWMVNNSHLNMIYGHYFMIT